MGQRLNIEITKNGKLLANAYYHWDAYSSTAISKTARIVHDYYDIYSIPLRWYPEEVSDMEIATRLLIMTGAGVDDLEHARITQNPPEALQTKHGPIILPKCVDRNSGLLCVTEEGMKDTRQWEEGRVTIDIGTQTVNFDVLSHYTKDEVQKYEIEDVVSELKSSDLDLSNQPFSAYGSGDISKFINKHPYGYKRGDEYILWVE